VGGYPTLVSRIVVVSTTEVQPGALDEVVDPGDELIVVAPAVEQSRLDWLANDEDEARRRAREVGEAISEEAPTAAAAIEVNPETPRQAVLDAIGEHRPDRVIVVLRDGDDASWMEEGELGDVPGEIGGVPITCIHV
jgi:hypothetical protein